MKQDVASDINVEVKTVEAPHVVQFLFEAKRDKTDDIA